MTGKNQLLCLQPKFTKATKIITKIGTSLAKRIRRKRVVGSPRVPANHRTADPSCISMAPPLIRFQPQLSTKKNMVTRTTDHESKEVSILTTLTAFWNWTKSRSWLIWRRLLEIFPPQPIVWKRVVIKCWRLSPSKSNLRHKKKLWEISLRSSHKKIIRTPMNLISHLCRLKTLSHFQIGVLSPKIWLISSSYAQIINLTQCWWTQFQDSKAPLVKRKDRLSLSISLINSLLSRPCLWHKFAKVVNRSSKML